MVLIHQSFYFFTLIPIYRNGDNIHINFKDMFHDLWSNRYFIEVLGMYVDCLLTEYVHVWMQMEKNVPIIMKNFAGTVLSFILWLR